MRDHDPGTLERRPDRRTVPVVAAWAVVALLSSFAVPAAAQPPPSTTNVDDMSLEQLMAVEVQSVFGASKFLQKVTEAPASVSVITADDIRIFGYRTLADVLRNTRGFYVNDDRSYAYAGIRGFQRPGDYNTHLLILIDGHRANDNVYDQAYVDEALPVGLEDVERIEIIRGPSSSLYGSNAFFGVVNIQTKSGRQMKGMQATVETGSFGHLSGRVSLGRAFSNGLDMTFSAAVADTDGPRELYFAEYDTPATNGGIAEGLDWTRRRRFRAKASYGGLTLQAGWNNREKGLPTGAWGISFNRPSSVVDSWGFADASFAHTWVSGLSLRARAFYDSCRYDGRYIYDSDEEASGVVEGRERGDGKWAGGELTLGRAVGRRHHVTGGIEYRNNLRQHQISYDVDPRVLYLDDLRRSTAAGFYLQDQITLSRKVLVNLGLRKDIHSSFESPAKLRAALIVTPTPASAVKVLYGGAFRAPNVYEMFYQYDPDAVGGSPYKSNPALRPEDIDTFEVAWEYYLGRRVRIGAGAYAYQVHNLIAQVLDPRDGLLVFQNTESVAARGVDGEVEAKWAGGTTLRASYAFQRVRDDLTDLTIPNSPAHVGQVSVAAPVGRMLTIAAAARALGSRSTVAGTTRSGYVVPSVIVTTAPIGERVSFRLIVDNLFDHRYFDPVSSEYRQDAIQQNGRTVVLGLTAVF